MATNRPLTLSLGEVLWDMLPDGKALGGSPTNAAWHMAQLGADCHVASAVGQDDLGREVLDILREKRLNVEAIEILPGKPTSTVDAMLGPDGNATYVIHENVAWDYIEPTPRLMDLAKKCRAVNYGSLSQRGPVTRATTLGVLDATPGDAVRVFDINLRPPFVYKDVLDAGMKRATAVKMNGDELGVVAGLYGWPENDPHATIAKLRETYPNLRHVVVTQGGEGAWWNDGRRTIVKKSAKPVKVVDTIGAGDSVTAVVMMGLLKGWDEADILQAAVDIASFVCSRRGAMPELPDELKAVFLQ